MTQHLTGIFNARDIDPLLTIGGQPKIEQIDTLQKFGFEAIIQINVKEASNNTKNEAFHAGLNNMTHVSMDMSYLSPTLEDVQAFCHLMDKHRGKRVYAHCAAGFCTSALLVIYKMLKEGLALEEARAEYAVTNWSLSDKWFALIEKATQVELEV